MNIKSAIIISPVPLKPVKSGMQNTINLLYKFLREKNFKIYFFEIKTKNIIDPILNLKINKNLIDDIEIKLKKSPSIELVFVNTSKILFQYKSILLDKNRRFKTVLVCHDLYYFRKKYFDKINIKDKTRLNYHQEISVLRNTDYIIDFSKKEFDFFVKKKISKKKLIKTLTPTSKFKKNFFSKKKYDILYVSSNWFQNKLSVHNFIKKTNKKFKYSFLILGDLLFKKKKNIEIHPYSKEKFNKCKIGLAFMRNSTGRQTKIFEMLSAGLPVFTNVDLSEFGLKNSKHYKFFDKRKKLHIQLKHLIENKNLRKKLSKNAFDWSQKYSFYRNAFKPINQILNH
jgi:hypothetical protein